MLSAVINEKYNGKEAAAILYKEDAGYFLVKKMSYVSMLILLHKGEYFDCKTIQLFRDVNLELVAPIINERLKELKDKRITEKDLEFILRAALLS